jgi:hypothetical protein
MFKMVIQGEPAEERKRNNKKSKKQIQKDSIQYNRQDLDQEQKVDVNPVQLNSQNIHIHVINDINKYCGRITGTVYLEKNKQIAVNTNVYLFFGNDGKLPVYQVKSDSNGNFVIEDIPPGFYTLWAECGPKLCYRSHYIKIMPGQTLHESILLTEYKV